MTNGGVLGYPSASGHLSELDARYGTDRVMATGESCIPRWLTPSSLSTTSGTVYLSFFTALQTETITKIRTTTGGTNAGATPTLCRVGMYAVDSSDNCSLLAASANTTSLWASTFTGYTTSLNGSVAKVAGQRYALALIIVTGAATPTLTGASLGTLDSNVKPAMSAVIASQSDLPSNIVAGSLAALGRVIYLAALQ